jgi:hypothetical protein
VAIIALVSPLPVAQSDTLTVCASGCDYTSIHAAVAAASPGDTIDVAAGTYSGNLLIDESVTIQGAGADQTTILGGATVIMISPTISVTVSGVTITGGQYENPVGGNLYTGGGGIFNAGALTLADSVVRGNTATGNGGAGADDYDRLGLGGGLFNFCAEATLINTTVRGNTAQGGDQDLGLAGGEANGGAGYGGGIFNLNSTLTLITSTVGLNEAAGGTGIGGSGSVGRGGPGRGAGIYNFGWMGGGCSATAAVTLMASTVHGNRALGGLGLGGGGLTGSGLGGFGSGGAIYDVGDTGLNASVLVSNSTISTNDAIGGDACSGPDANPSAGHGFGGGISSNALTLTSSTVAYNRAAGGTAAGVNCTVGLPAFNGSGFGGGLEHGGSILYQSARNTIVAYNAPDNCVKTITSNGNNLEIGTSCGFAGAGDLQTASAGLAPLQYRDATVLVHPLYIGSPALDAGDNATCPPGDQRGQARPLDGVCDIGAFEGWIYYELHLPLLTRP